MVSGTLFPLDSARRAENRFAGVRFKTLLPVISRASQRGSLSCLLIAVRPPNLPRNRFKEASRELIASSSLKHHKLCSVCGYTHLWTSPFDEEQHSASREKRARRSVLLNDFKTLSCFSRGRLLSLHILIA